jgi:hypothetical protein
MIEREQFAFIGIPAEKAETDAVRTVYIRRPVVSPCFQTGTNTSFGKRQAEEDYLPNANLISSLMNQPMHPLFIHQREHIFDITPPASGK